MERELKIFLPAPQPRTEQVENDRGEGYSGWMVKTQGRPTPYRIKQVNHEYVMGPFFIIKFQFEPNWKRNWIENWKCWSKFKNILAEQRSGAISRGKPLPRPMEPKIIKTLNELIASVGFRLCVRIRACTSSMASKMLIGGRDLANSFFFNPPRTCRLSLPITSMAEIVCNKNGLRRHVYSSLRNAKAPAENLQIRFPSSSPEDD